MSNAANRQKLTLEEVIAQTGGSSDQQIGRNAVALAKRFHELYEELAPTVGYETRQDTRKPWAELPRENRQLMIAVCSVILAQMRDEGGQTDA